MWGDTILRWRGFWLRRRWGKRCFFCVGYGFLSIFLLLLCSVLVKAGGRGNEGNDVGLAMALWGSECRGFLFSIEHNPISSRRLFSNFQL